MTLVELILVVFIGVLVLLLESQMKTTKKAFADVHQLELERASLQFQIKNQTAQLDTTKLMLRANAETNESKTK